MDLLIDEYLIEVTEAKRRRGGYRVQVYDRGIDGDWQPTLSESALPWRVVGLWRATYDGALHCGISEAYEQHGALAAPLVVLLADGTTLIDERLSAPVGE